MRRAILLSTGVVLALAAVGLGQEGGVPQTPYEAIVADMLTAIEQINKTLKTVKDQASADAARPELKKSVGQIVALRDKAAKLPQPDMTERNRISDAYRQKLALAVKELRAERIRVRDIPGGRDALKELDVLEPMKKDEPPEKKDKKTEG